MKRIFLALLIAALATPLFAQYEAPLQAIPTPGTGGGGGSGTVTSVDATVPSVLTLSGNPVTTSGTLAFGLATQSANVLWAGPTSGGAATPTFRTMVSADIPASITLTAPTIASFTNATHGHTSAATGGTLSAAAIGSGQLALARGGTNADLSATGGANQIVRQNSSGGAFTVSALAAGDIPAIAESGVTNLVSDLAAKCALAGCTMSGTLTSQIVAPGTDNNYTLGAAGFRWAILFMAGPVVQKVGTAVASASTIAPVTAIVHITGTAAIATITPFSNLNSSGNGGSVTLIPDGIFTTTTAGNIALASTAVVNRPLIMVYDNATSKWYPSY